MTAIATSTCLLASILLTQTSTSAPWTMPGNFLQRLRISDLVVSGTIESSLPLGVQTVDGTELAANTARLRVDRVFQGKTGDELQFTWFTFYFSGKGGYAYSGPPVADFHIGERYLVFLKRDKSGWVVAIPMYALEIELAPESPPGSLRDFSLLLPQQRDEAIAQELEAAALLVPVPPLGMTGEAAAYFSPVFDLLGGCAEPFYRWFATSPSPELRTEALRWLNLIGHRRLRCNSAVAPLK